ncbi:MAG: hypothetical protein ACI9XO_002777 [Paraglaciecola sp.]|jgi:hypothetical protein
MKRIIFILLFGITSTIQSKSQNIDSTYFLISKKEESRWKKHEGFIENSEIVSESKADTLLEFANIEYVAQQYSKARELCELALSLNSDLGEAHNLIGKTYVSSSKICNGKADDFHKVKEEIIWVALDEWELALSKSNAKKEEALMLMERYSIYLPTKEHFKNCFTDATLKEGDEYYVGCWIQRKTKVRFNKKY